MTGPSVPRSGETRRTPQIANYVEEETQGRVNIDHTTAREYKEQYADFVSFDPFTDVVQQPGGGAHEFTIEDSVMNAMNEYVDRRPTRRRGRPRVGPN